jgi:hypothetical protein
VPITDSLWAATNQATSVNLLVARGGIEPPTFRFSGGQNGRWPAVYLRLCVVCAALSCADVFSLSDERT